MSIGFFGSPSFAKEIFGAIHERFGIAYAVTQPSKPVGRNQEITPSPIHSIAKQANVPVYTPDNLSSFLLPATDVAVVVAYGKIMPEKLLNQSRFGFFNVHYSLLPKYRGASPVQFALTNGEKQTGTTIFQLTERLDDGPIAEQVTVSIEQSETSSQLIKRLTHLSVEPLLKLLTSIEKNGTTPKLIPQTGRPTIARTLTKNDGFIAFETLKKILANQPISVEGYPPFITEQVGKNNLTINEFNYKAFHNLVRACNPWPIVWTMLPNTKRVRIFETAIEDVSVVLKTIQLEGKTISSDSKFIARLLEQTAAPV